MKSTRFWILLIGIFFVLSAAASFFVLRGTADNARANVYKDGVCVHSVSLSEVSEPYEFAVSGAVINTVRVERGRICVKDASCPDKLCVHSGWIDTGVLPIVCLPNALVIRIENTPGDGVDAVSR